MYSEQSPKKSVEFNFTGFGPFGNITQNPTTELVKTIINWKKNGEVNWKIGDAQVLEVSAKAADTYVQEIIKRIDERRKEDANTIQIIIHFGVYSGSKEFRLELHGYNEANFRIPDMLNFSPKQKKIKAAFPIEHYFRTIFPIEKLEVMLKKYPVCLSTDPGRYLCNYIYYSTMYEGYKRDIPSIFIHVPEFKDVCQEKQENFIKDFVSSVNQILAAELSDYNSVKV